MVIPSYLVCLRPKVSSNASRRDSRTCETFCAHHREVGRPGLKQLSGGGVTMVGPVTVDRNM